MALSTIPLLFEQPIELLSMISRSFSCHQKMRLFFPSISSPVNILSKMDLWDRSLFLNWLATVLHSSSSLDALSAPIAKRMMRHFVFNSFLRTRLSKIVFLRVLPFLQTPPLHPASSALVNSPAQILVTHAALLASEFVFGVTAFTNFFRTLVHAARLKNESMFGS